MLRGINADQIGYIKGWCIGENVTIISDINYTKRKILHGLAETSTELELLAA